MDLAAHQRALLELVENEGVSPSGEVDREYLEDVARSDGLRVLREIVSAWEAYDVRRACPLTTLALDGGGRFDEVVAGVRFESATAYLESRRALFLDEVARAEDGTVASVAEFERALQAVAAGDRDEHAIEWDRDPTVIINGLLDGQWLHDSAAEGAYRTVVAADIPGYVRVESLEH